MRASSPCLNCMERHVGCHDNCKNYIDFRKRLEAERERERKGQLWEYKKEKMDGNLRWQVRNR